MYGATLKFTEVHITERVFISVFDGVKSVPLKPELLNLRGPSEWNCITCAEFNETNIKQHCFHISYISPNFTQIGH